MDAFRQAEALRRRADDIEARAVVKEDIKKVLPDDADTVIFFRKRFDDGITYTYGAVAFKLDGRSSSYWATTGPRSPKYYTTDELIEWMTADNGVEELWVCTEFTEV